MTALTEVGEEGLRKMLEVCTDFSERRQIRAALRALQFGSIPGLLAGHSNNNSNNHILTTTTTAMAKRAPTEMEKKLSTMTDLEEMEKMLHSTSDFNDRMAVRTSIRELKKKKQAEAEAAKAAGKKGKAGAKVAPAPKKELHLEGIEDEGVLRKLYEETEDAEQKKQIMHHIRDLRQKAREEADNVISKEEDQYRKAHHLNEEPAIPAVSVVDVEIPRDKDGVVDFTSIDDIPTLEQVLHATDDFGERCQIREHLKELHERANLEVPDYPNARRLSEGLEANIFQSERERRRSSLIDRAALEELTHTEDVVDNVCYDEIEDPEELESMLANATDIGEKRMIRGALTALRKKLEDVSRREPDRRKSPDRELSKRDTDSEARRTRWEGRLKKKTDSSGVGTRPAWTGGEGERETPRTPDAGKQAERRQTDNREKARDCPNARTKAADKENAVATSRLITYLESCKTRQEDTKPRKSSVVSPAGPHGLLAPKEKNNNNEVAFRTGGSRIVAPPPPAAADVDRPRRDASKLPTPSRLDSTQRENERNRKETALASRLTKFAAPTSDAGDSRRHDRSSASPPSSSSTSSSSFSAATATTTTTSSSSRSERTSRAGKDSSPTGPRLSRLGTPSPPSSQDVARRARKSSVPTPSGSKLESLRSRFSGATAAAATNSPRQAETKLVDRALKGTRGKVSETASKFGGSCSGSSCSSTPSQSPSSSAPSSPKRRPLGKVSYATPPAHRTFEFGKIHNPSLARTPAAKPTPARSTSATPTSAAPTLAKPASATPTPARFTSATPTSATPTSTRFTSATPTSARSTSATPATATPSSATPTLATPASATPVSATPASATPTPAYSYHSSKTKYGATPLPAKRVPSPESAPSRSQLTPSSKTAGPSLLASKEDSKTTTLRVPLGKGFSLELQTPSDKTVTVEPKSRYQSSQATELPHTESKLRDRFGHSSPRERTSVQSGRHPAEEKRNRGRGAGDSQPASPDKMPPVEDIEDEEALEKMLDAASDFEERKKIRSKLREIRKKRRDAEDKRVSDQQKAVQDDILRNREEVKSRGIRAVATTPLPSRDAKTTEAGTKTPLNNNTLISRPGSGGGSSGTTTTPSVQTSTTTVESLDGKSKTMSSQSVIEGPGSKTMISTTLSKSEDKDTKTQSMKQETMSVKKEESSSGSSFSSKSSSVSSSITTSSSTGAPPTKKMTKFEMEMEEKKRQREQKRTEEEKNWKEYMAKKKDDEQQKRKQAAAAASKKKDALMNKFGGKAEQETGGFGKGTGMAAVPNASTIKQKLLEWCQRCATGYPEVKITNFSSCWADGMAFCAIVHYHFPNAFDFEVLDKKNRRKNFDLAFESAEKHADIMPLLETDDMIMMKNKPDWKCVFTYVQSLYRHLSKLKQ